MPKIITQESVIDRFRKVHGDTYNYDRSVYIEMRQKIEIVCPVHGSFWQLPTVHLRGCGCPDCAYYGFNPLKPAILYYMKHLLTGYYKSGITNRTLRQRFGGRLKEFQVIDVQEFQVGGAAYKREQELLLEYSEHRITLVSFIGNGGTEFFDSNVREL